MALKKFLGIFPNSQEGAVALPVAQFLFEMEQRKQQADAARATQEMIAQQNATSEMDVQRLRNTGYENYHRQEAAARATEREENRKATFIGKMVIAGIKYDPSKGDPESQYLDGIKIKAEGFAKGVDRETQKVTDAGNQISEEKAKHEKAAHEYAVGQIRTKLKNTGVWTSGAEKKALMDFDKSPQLHTDYEHEKANYEKLHPYKDPISAVLKVNAAEQRLKLMKPEPEYAPFIADYYMQLDANQPIVDKGEGKGETNALPKETKMQKPPPAVAAQGPAGTPGGAGTAVMEAAGRGIPATVLGGVTQKSLAPLWALASKGPWPVKAAGLVGKYGAPAAAGAAGWALGDAGINAIDPNAPATWAAHPALSMMGSIASSAAYPLVPSVQQNGRIAWPAWMGRPAQAAPAPLGQWQGPTLPARYVGPGGPGAGPAGYTWNAPPVTRSAYPMPDTMRTQIAGRPMLALPPAQAYPMPSAAEINAMRPVYASPQYMPQPQAQIAMPQQLALPPVSSAPLYPYQMQPVPPAWTAPVYPPSPETLNWMQMQPMR